jgi:hypothetical protein
MIDKMATKSIYNCRRSGDLSETVTVRVDMETPDEKIDILRQKMLDFVKENSRRFRPTCRLDILEMGDFKNMISIRFGIDFKGNAQDGGRKSDSRTMFLKALRKSMLELQLTFVVPVQRVQQMDPFK